MRQFVADAGHELRTPLTIVLGYIDLLRRKADAGDERSRRIFSSISVEGARMRTLIDNLVLLAKMEGEDVRPPEPFDLRELIDEIVESRRLIHPGVRLSCNVSVDAKVVGDRTEIYEAIANVVDNAFKYAPGSPVLIEAKAADGGVEVTVTDEGPGIHPDDRDAIFDRFYRGATRGEVEGSGLGLAIAKTRRRTRRRRADDRPHVTQGHDLRATPARRPSPQRTVSPTGVSVMMCRSLRRVQRRQARGTAVLRQAQDDEANVTISRMRG